MTSFVVSTRSHRICGTGGMRWSQIAACALAMTGCTASAPRYAVELANVGFTDPQLGVSASPRLVADGEPVPRGGGGYLVGRPYVIAGRTYYPSDRAQGYTVVGTASWYGDAFHGRRTANGEIFDKGSITAAHPTLPLPSYVRVTNLKNNRSMIVRVNDRGPFHGGRVMDVSQRVAEALAFKAEGTAQIRVDYVGRASLAGSDSAKLLATLREGGVPAQFDGDGAMVASTGEALPPDPSSAVAPDARPGKGTGGGAPGAPRFGRLSRSFIVPPARPSEAGDISGAPPPRTDNAAVSLAPSPDGTGSSPADRPYGLRAGIAPADDVTR